MSFDHPELLPLAVALPAVVLAAALLWARRRRRAARALGAAALLQRLGAAGLERTPWGRLPLLVGAALALGVAAAGPRWGLETVEQETRSADVVLALDVSRSMLARDVTPTRLERARVLARRILRELPGDRVGLVAFAGRAYVLAPLTVDHGALHLYLDALDPEIVSQGGSSLAAAVRQASDLAPGVDGTGRGTVVLVSDGEDLLDEAAVEEAAGEAAEAGVVIHTVGVGTAGGAPVPESGEAGVVDRYTRDEVGEIVISRLNEPLLERVAAATGGRYVRLSEGGGSARVLAMLQGLDRAGAGTEQQVRTRARYAGFVLLALVLLAVDALLAVRRPRDRAAMERGLPARPAAAEVPAVGLVEAADA